MVEQKSRCVILAALIGMLNGWGFMVVGPAYPSIATDLLVTPEISGLIISVYALPGIFLAPLFGMLSDRIGRRKVVIPLITIFLIAGLAAGFSPSFTILLIFRFIQGIAVASFFSLAFMIVGDLYSGNARSNAVATIFSIGMGLNIVIPFVGGFLTLISWRLTFFSFIVALPILLGVIFILPETNPRLTHPSFDTKKPESSVTMNPNLISFLPKGLLYALFGAMFLGFCFFVTTFGAVNLFSSFYIENSIGMNSAVTGVFQTIQSIIAWVVTLFMGRIMTRLSKPILSVLTFLFFAGGCFFYMLPPNPIWLIPIGGFFGLSFGISFTTLNAFVLDLAPPLKRGIVTSLFQAVIKLGQTIGPIALGFSFAWSGNQIATPFIIAMGISLIAAVVSLPLVQFSKRTGLGAPHQ